MPSSWPPARPAASPRLLNKSTTALTKLVSRKMTAERLAIRDQGTPRLGAVGFLVALGQAV